MWNIIYVSNMKRGKTMATPKKENFVMTIGMNDKITCKQKLSKTYFINEIGKLIPACTISENVGFYKGMREKSLEVKVYDISKEEINQIAEELRDIFNQECIAVAKLNVETYFI